MAIVLLCLAGSVGQVLGAAPKGIAHLFVDCPMLAVTDDGFLVFDAKAEPPLSDRQENFKQDFLVEPEGYAKGTTVVVDEANRYLSVDGPEGLYNLVLVFYKRPTGSLIPALRFSSNEGQFPEVSWGFYDSVPDGRWLRIPDASVLPPDAATAFFTSKLNQTDRDLLSLCRWDIALPHFGVTAHLVLQPYESDLDDPRRILEIPGTKRTTTQGALAEWFNRNFTVGQEGKALELRWVKASSRFTAGAIVPWHEGINLGEAKE